MNTSHTPGLLAALTALEDQLDIARVGDNLVLCVHASPFTAVDARKGSVVYAHAGSVVYAHKEDASAHTDTAIASAKGDAS